MIGGGGGWWRRWGRLGVGSGCCCWCRVFVVGGGG